MADVGLGSIVKKVAGGFISKTLARLRGSGISTESRIVKARAKWAGRHDKKDWRVRLQIPASSTLDGYFFDNNPLLAPLMDHRGFVFPLTPSMIIQHSANYNALAQTHSNYPFQAYQNSQVDQMNIIGEFPVQNYDDAKYWVATVNFLRTVTKMFFGKDQDFKGNPPPILQLSAYGDHMFNKVPVIVQTFNVELRSGIDYISTKQSNVNSSTPGNIDVLSNTGEDQTWAPTLSTVSVGIIPVYSRESIKNFSLADFAQGKLSGKGEGEIGFI